MQADSFLTAAAAAKSLQSCPTLCDPIDGSPPGSPLPGILQARTLEWLPFPSPMHESESEVAQSCPTPSNPMDCSLPGSSVHGIFQARVLELVAISFSMLDFRRVLKVPLCTLTCKYLHLRKRDTPLRAWAKGMNLQGTVMEIGDRWQGCSHKSKGPPCLEPRPPWCWGCPLYRSHACFLSLCPGRWGWHSAEQG